MAKPPASADNDSGAETAPRGRQLVKRLYVPRILGLGLGFFCVAGTFWELHVATIWWVVLGFTSYVWPHLAYVVALRARRPFHAEHRNLLIDSLLGGFLVPVMQFNLVPSVVILVMMSLNHIAVGGLSLFARGLCTQLIGVALAVALVGARFQLQSGLMPIVACIPFLIFYPLMIGLLTFQLATRLSIEKRQVELLSRTDGLTGLNNRMFFEQQLLAEFARSRRQHQPCVLLLADIDHFKRINDEGGHAAGDDVLRLTARLLRDRLRPFDIVGRIGGEEFGVVLPNTSPTCAGQIAERLRAAIAALQLPHALQHCTISIGIAVLDDAVSDCAHWQLRADRALYRAKQEGRNRVISHNPDAAAS